MLSDKVVPIVGVNWNAILEELDLKWATALHLSEHYSETQFPQYSAEFFVRIHKVSHTCFFNRAAQESGGKKSIHAPLTIVICKSPVFVFVCFECVVGWADTKKC